MAPSANIVWVAFENDLMTANDNCRHRKNKGDAEGHIKLNNLVSPQYTIPVGVTPLAIYRLSEHA